MENTKKKTKSFSFQRGFGQIQNKDLPAVRKELMKALGVTSRMSLNNYLNGKVIPKVPQAEAVETVFNRYGITDIWGES